MYTDKLTRLSTVISMLGKDVSPDGIAMLGVAEVENRKVLEDLVAQPLLKDMDLHIIHYESEDFRGIDVGLLYQPKYFTPISSKPINLPIYNSEDEWAVHQLKTTANFATNNRVISWLVGGLNFQVEHHLFPRVSHVHYPEISKIIKNACQEFGVPYIEYPKMRMAVASHITHLKSLSRK